MSINRVPIVLVARDDAGPMVGTASLLFDDLEGDPRNPWLVRLGWRALERREYRGEHIQVMDKAL